MHTTTQHIGAHEMMRMEEQLGGRLLRQALQIAAEKGDENFLLRIFHGPLMSLSEEEQKQAIKDLKGLFNLSVQALQRAKEEEELDQLAEEEEMFRPSV